MVFSGDGGGIGAVSGDQIRDVRRDLRQMADETEVKQKRKNRPGQGRKKKESTVYKEANEKFLNAAPEVAEATLRRAIGGPVPITCPDCGKEFEYKIPGLTGDTKLLEYCNDRIHGKPTIKTDINLNAKVELENTKLVQYHLLVMQTDQQVQEIDTSEFSKRYLTPPVDNTVNGEVKEINV